MSRIDVINAIYYSILDLEDSKLAGIYENLVDCEDCKYVYKCHNYNRKCSEFIRHSMEDVKEDRQA